MTTMGKDTFTRAAFTSTKQAATDDGRKSATHDAEQRVRSGLGLDELVSPKGYGAIRRSLPRFESILGGRWRLTRGLPLLFETLLDTTGSMGDNVSMAFENLPGFYDLLTAGSRPVANRYDPQVINACFGDTSDQGTPVLCRSQAEMDVKIGSVNN